MVEPVQIDIEDAIAAAPTTYLDGKVVLHAGDCRDVIAALPDCSVDAIVTDPPYALVSIVKRFGKEGSAPAKSNGATGVYARASSGFMGQAWDTGEVAFAVEFWAEAFRVLKPGGHVVAFSGTRTYHRLACAIEDAGFEVRDTIMWVYGSGFPKSTNVAKMMDKAAGVEPVIVPAGAAVKRMIPGADQNDMGSWVKNNGRTYQPGEYVPTTPQAIEWNGWGTALKPSFEPLCLAQKPLINGQNIAIIGSTITDLVGRLWSMLSAKDAATRFGSSRSAFDEACASARWSAADASNTRGALSAQMGTSQFGSALISSLSTVSSWSATLAEALTGENTSIIGTGSSTTIDLKTLMSCLSKITPESIIQAHRSGAWSSADASPAERYLSAVVTKLRGTLELSAAESALSQALTDFPDGIGSIKPASNSAVLARKPLIGTVVANVLAHGTGALNIDGCRIEAQGRPLLELDAKPTDSSVYVGRTGEGGLGKGLDGGSKAVGTTDLGRWPANLAHDGSDEVLECFPFDAGASAPVLGTERSKASIGVITGERERVPGAFHSDSGSAARFFATFSESDQRLFYTSKAGADDRLGSKHPTVKPVDLMQWLVRLVCPKGGTILDPFAGTGTTGEAAWREGMRAILIEREDEYLADIARRMELAVNPTKRAAVAKTKNNLDDPSKLPLFAGADGDDQ